MVDNETTGGGTTVIVTVPVTGRVQLGVPDVAMLTKVYEVVVVKFPVIDAVPDAFKTTV